MKGRGLQPDVITLSVAISACEKGGQWQKAMELFESMKSRGMQPNVITISAAISAFEKGGQWQKALYLIESMEPAARRYHAERGNQRVREGRAVAKGAGAVRVDEGPRPEARSSR